MTSDYIQVNRTRYDTEDLDRIYIWIAKQIRKFWVEAPEWAEKNQDMLPRWVKLGPTRRNDVPPEPKAFKVLYWTQRAEGDEEEEHVRPYDNSSTNLAIESLNKMKESRELWSLTLSRSGASLPTSVVYDIILFFVNKLTKEFHLSTRYYRVGLRLQEIREEVLGGAMRQGFSVRIHSRIRDPRPKATKERTNQRLLDEYGRGGILIGGSRDPEWCWLEPIDKACKHYEREYERRQGWRKKCEAAGLEVEPYETWAEFLRRIANDWERRNNKEKS